MKHAAPLSPFAPTLNSLAQRVRCGLATAADFGAAMLMLRLARFASRRERREAAAALGALRLTWTVTA